MNLPALCFGMLLLAFVQGGIPASGEIEEIPELAPADPARASELRELAPGGKFRWEMEVQPDGEKLLVGELRFPSPRPSGDPVNDVVRATYFRPAARRDLPAAVVLHHSQDDFKLERAISRDLALAGVATLMLRLPWYGERRPPGTRTILAAERGLGGLESDFRQAAADALRAVSWLRARKEVDSKRVGLVGISLGALVGSLAAGASGTLDRCVLVLGGGDLATILRSPVHETSGVRTALEREKVEEAELRTRIERLDPLRFADRICGARTLFVQASKDEIVPRVCSEKLIEAVSAKDGRPRVRWFDASHKSIVFSLPEVMQEVKQHFMPGAESKPATEK
ncbi:MAG: alpha/beta fold hydrolase [Planctomycetes bacterium]|nr:alpha/beta fold hydrolase [Planctomycetota bacterium]